IFDSTVETYRPHSTLGLSVGGCAHGDRPAAHRATEVAAASTKWTRCAAPVTSARGRGHDDFTFREPKCQGRSFPGRLSSSAAANAIRCATDAHWSAHCSERCRRALQRGGTMIDDERQMRPGSEVHLDEWVTPEIADEHGYIRAGKVLEWMDVVGVLAATRHCRSPVVTASIDGMELQKPIRVGERLAMTASVAFTTPRSIGVSVAMRHGAPDDATPPSSVAGYMTFVALDDEGKPLHVPQFQPETPAEVARFREGRLRSEFRKKMLSGQLPDLDAVNAPAPENPLFIRELLKLLPRSLQLPFERGRATGERHPHPSYVHKIEPIRGGKLNFHGTPYGGTLMRWIESSAQLSARSHLHGNPVRLVGLHGLTFIRPVARHVFIHVRSAIAHTGTDSLTALVNVHAEDPTAGSQTETLRAFLTYAPVAANGAGAPAICALECVGDEELGLFKEVEHRLALQRTLRDGSAGAMTVPRAADLAFRETR